MWAVRVRSRHFNGRQPSGIGKYKNSHYFDCGMSLLCGMKIPQYEFVLKMQGGLCARGGGGGGGVFAGHYGITHTTKPHRAGPQNLGAHERKMDPGLKSPEQSFHLKFTNQSDADN